MEQIAQYAGLYGFQAVVPVSAKDGSGMEDLLDELKKLCLPGGHLFPEDTLTDQPEAGHRLGDCPGESAAPAGQGGPPTGWPPSPSA